MRIFYLPLIYIIAWSCQTEILLPETNDGNSDLIFQCIISPTNNFEIFVSEFGDIYDEMNPIKAILYENEIAFDSLILDSLGHIRSDKFNNLIDYNNEYQLVLYNNQNAIAHTSIIKTIDSILITTCELKDTIANPSSNNLTLEGYFDFEKQMADKQISATLEIKELRPRFSLPDTIIDSQYSPFILINNSCVPSENIYPFRYYSSMDISCLENELNRIYFRNPNFSKQDSMVSGKIKLCNISNETRLYFESIDQYFEGTEFFFEPTGSIEFNIQTAEIKGHFSTISCSEFEINL